MPSQDPGTSISEAGKVAIVGAGSIGSAFAVVFAAAGCEVALFDTMSDSLQRAQSDIRRSLEALAEHALLRQSVDEIVARIALCEGLGEAVDGAGWVHECAPERLEIKVGLFKKLDAITSPECILASATSAIQPSQIAGDLPGRARCLVAHPGNPPFLLRVLELVPAAFTSEATIDRARAFTRRVGLEPVLVRREVEGFIFNRLQGALLREAYCLVRDGVASVEDIDTIVRKGLGLRWSVIGPFETADLNTRGGIESHAQKLGPAYARMGAERGQHDPWTPEMIAQVVAARRAQLPLEKWSERVAWRDRELMKRLAATQQEAGSA